MGQTEELKCSICGKMDGTITQDIKDERLYINCPICGRYILPFNSFFLLDIQMGYKDEERYDVRKLVSYLFHNKISDRYAFIGITREFDKYKEYNPQSVAYLVTPEVVENWYPKTIIEKRNKSLLYLLKQTTYLGCGIIVTAEQCKSVFFLENDYDNYDETKNNKWGHELICLLNYLVDGGYIMYDGENIDVMVANLCSHNYNAFAIALTAKAFEDMERLQMQQSNNKNVFVAMKFGDETIALRDKIKEGLEGYNVRIMDEIEHNNQIVPEMLHEIQNSRFVVAELSHHNNGAYYEAGFAYGCGKEVIHICSQKELKNGLHFDVAQINTIIYDNIEEIPKKLKRRIQATIK